eukprot:TRINITY_DN111643_c0_g1_i1.p1 TRINITY_DN111643_c0_g1~~TRINITY_DN111643_c0_g1_i1.p1  ORF type:complete len:127 (+),score=15.97 TRINITY_DN111643_c0_g1_i1:56-382(+)
MLGILAHNGMQYRRRRGFTLWFCFFLFVQVLQCHAGGSEADRDKDADFRRDFNEFDLNQDGVIDVQELRVQMTQELDQNHLRRLIIDMDQDQSGLISVEEYIAYAITL